MAKRELRLGVVIYGGASLAVYMHGVTKELLKLVRASKVLHEMGADRAADLPAYSAGPDSRPADTEAVYFEILRSINQTDQFRVVIDVIAGASAGAINGVMLAKALVDDARLDEQTSLWLDGVDSETLAAEQVGRWRKWYLYPVFRLLAGWLPHSLTGNSETRRKVARVARASWLRPPFSGARLVRLLFDGFDQLARSRRPGSSLLPPGQRLDVYASLTDLVGYPRAMRVHERLVARETEHAVYCHLSHPSRTAEGYAAGSDLSDDNVPALVWAARASSSYAGAFPPFRHDEIHQVLLALGRGWPGEREFLESRLRTRDGDPISRRVDPAERYFVDGGIVINKPFGAVLEALNYRPADRQVYRRLLYVEPNPDVGAEVTAGRSPSYLGTLQAALSSIPRNQPILDELSAVAALDARVEINRRIIDAHRGRIEALTAEQSALHASQSMTGELVTYLRLALEDRAEQEMGIAYDGYVQRRLWRLVDLLARSWSSIGADEHEPMLERAIEQAIADWWAPRGEGDADPGRRRLHRQQSFLEHFDVSCRIRRLQFLIRRVNQLRADRSLAAEIIDRLDAFKAEAYLFIEQYYEIRRAERLDPAFRRELQAMSAEKRPDNLRVRELLHRLGDSFGLEALDRSFDAALAAALLRFLAFPGGSRVRDALLVDYVGFPFFDVLLLAPGTLDDGPDPLTPVRVERISPVDAQSLNEIFEGLRSRELVGFLGFFNRDYREYDYLWGRLNGAERLVDILADIAPDALSDSLRFKRMLFAAIVAAERDRLPSCGQVLDAVAAALDRWA